MDKDVIFKLEMKRIGIDGDTAKIRMSVNDSNPDNATKMNYRFEDLIIIVQALSNMTHYFASALSQHTIGGIEIDKTKYSGPGEQ